MMKREGRSRRNNADSILEQVKRRKGRGRRILSQYSTTSMSIKRIFKAFNLPRNKISSKTHAMHCHIVNYTLYKLTLCSYRHR